MKITIIVLGLLFVKVNSALVDDHHSSVLKSSNVNRRDNPPDRIDIQLYNTDKIKNKNAGTLTKRKVSGIADNANNIANDQDEQDTDTSNNKYTRKQIGRTIEDGVNKNIQYYSGIRAENSNAGRINYSGQPETRQNVETNGSLLKNAPDVETEKADENSSRLKANQHKRGQNKINLRRTNSAQEIQFGKQGISDFIKPEKRQYKATTNEIPTLYNSKNKNINRIPSKPSQQIDRSKLETSNSDGRRSRLGLSSRRGFPTVGGYPLCLRGEKCVPEYQCRIKG